MYLSEENLLPFKPQRMQQRRLWKSGVLRVLLLRLGSRGGPLPWNLRVEFPKTTSAEISNEKGKLGHLARPPASFLHCG